MADRTLDRYRLVERIGAGGMGEVWKAHDARLNRTVAIKRLLRSAVADDTHHERFRREALTLSRLSHSGIATIFDFESAGDHDLLVMEFVPGGTLESRLREGPLRLEEVRSIGASIADALEDAHRQGVLHRDLKPGNVALTSDGRPKILDFGLALLVSGEAMTGRLTQAGTVMGSLAYMAPEQLAGEEEDARTDIYALGATLFELATGQRPFSQERPQALMFAIINTPAPSLRSFRADATADLDGLIAACLEKDRARRPASAATVAEVLRQVPAIQSSGAAPATARGAIRAIAVLPFRNVSSDPAQEYFADGMTEAVISDLARIKALRVISRTSAMRYKGTTLSLPEIARELNVDAVLEGSAHLVGERVRLNVQLIAARTDETLWTERYDRQLENVLDLQSELAEKVARQIAVQLTPSEATHLARRHEVNPEAHLEYLKSRHSAMIASREGVDLGLRHAKRALDIDPDFAGAWAALADCHIIGSTRGMAPPAEAAAEATVAARRALELDPTLADAHVSLAIVQMHTGQLRDGIRSLRRAIELNPGLALAHSMLARALSSFERHEEAIAAAQKSVALDPLGSWLIHTVLGDCVLLRAPVREGRTDVSHVDRARTALRRRPHRPRALARSARPLRRSARGVRKGAHARGWRGRPFVRSRAPGGRGRQRRRGAAHSRRAHGGSVEPCRLGLGHRRRARESWRGGRGVPLARDRGAGKGVRPHSAARASAAGSDPIGPALLAARPARRPGRLPCFLSPIFHRNASRRPSLFARDAPRV